MLRRSPPRTGSPRRRWCCAGTSSTASSSSRSRRSRSGWRANLDIFGFRLSAGRGGPHRRARPAESHRAGSRRPAVRGAGAGAELVQPGPERLQHQPRRPPASRGRSPWASLRAGADVLHHDVDRAVQPGAVRRRHGRVVGGPDADPPRAVGGLVAPVQARQQIAAGRAAAGRPRALELGTSAARRAGDLGAVVRRAQRDDAPGLACGRRARATQSRTTTPPALKPTRSTDGAPCRERLARPRRPAPRPAPGRRCHRPAAGRRGRRVPRPQPAASASRASRRRRSRAPAAPGPASPAAGLPPVSERTAGIRVITSTTAARLSTMSAAARIRRRRLMRRG